MNTKVTLFLVVLALAPLSTLAAADGPGIGIPLAMIPRAEPPPPNDLIDPLPIELPELPPPPRPATAKEIHDLRVAKCTHIVKTFYDHEGRASFLPYVDYFVSYHENAERACPGGAPGFGATWYWSLVYGGANFSLRCYATAPGNCAGPMDVKHHPLVLDPKKNIAWHCNEMLGFYKSGVRGIDLCKHVFYPAAPRDWGGGRFRKTDAKFRACLQHAYDAGKLGLPEGVYYAEGG